MTEKGLYKMTAIECLQYALTSGIAAAVVCELMMFLTDKIYYLPNLGGISTPRFWYSRHLFQY
ncbi:MAG: hypothetical protein HDT43_05625 [Ruminococcaceae bacterium]|nr:hypothetical protein [Oscillospiraceae bacterium]